MKVAVPLLLIFAMLPQSLPIEGQSAPVESPINSRLDAGIIHGTIDVVVSTREGFTLASDSRVSRTVGGETSYNDDGEKLYAVGDHAACVIAGLVGSEVSGSGFQLKDAIGTEMRLLDQNARRRSEPLTALEISMGFRSGLERVALLLGERSDMVGTMAEASIVSVNPDGTSEWTGFRLPVQAEVVGPSRAFPVIGRPYDLRSRYVGRRFNVDLLGQPDIAERCWRPDGPRVTGIRERQSCVDTTC